MVEEEWKVIPDNFVIRVYSKGLAERGCMRRLDGWERGHFGKILDGVMRSLPNYRLSKLEPLMQACVEREIVARYLLIVAGARE